jgi:hypothetical protein
MNKFINTVTSYDSYTRNMAVSHSTTGNSVLDYFSKMSTYRDRPYESVAADVSKAWNDDPELTLKAIIYNRMITRRVKAFTWQTEDVQKGQGNRDESRKAWRWVTESHPEIAQANLGLFVLSGTWKDLWHEDLINVLDWDNVAEWVTHGLQSDYHRGLLAKYLPRIRKSKNDYHNSLNSFARHICSYLGWSERDYRKFKSSPENTAHLWQRQMSWGLWNSINFKTIPGKALFNMVSRKGRDKQTVLARHGLENKYLTWIQEQPVAKFTGYVYELFSKANKYNLPVIEQHTYNKQFDGLVAKAEAGIKGNVWCALDTSGSMGAIVAPNVTALDVCVSLGIYFSALNTGPFKDHVIMFDSTSKTMRIGGSFVDKVRQITTATTAWGSTNFQSVIDEIVRVRLNNPNIPVEDYPETLLVVSDNQFNPVGGNTETNYEAAMRKLRAVGLNDISIIWWSVNSSYGQDYTNKVGDRGVTMLSGFDGAVISLILGGEPKTRKLSEMTPYDQMLVALDQELLNIVQL